MAIHVERHHAVRILHRDTTDRRDRPPLTRGERILLAEQDLSGAPVVATTAALHYRTDQWRALPWEELGRVRWADGVLELTRFGGEPLRLRLAGSTRLPGVVRDLVGSTELIGTRIGLVDGRTGSVAARRRAGSGETIWVVHLPDGVDPTDPGVQARVDAAIRELRPLLEPNRPL